MPGRWQFRSDGGGTLTDTGHFSQRFTGRVESYRQFRPRYPDQVVSLLEKESRLTTASAIADIAAGTGLLTEIFLARGYTVAAVEPNIEMRAACEKLVPKYPRLRCFDGTAEATGLPSESFDLITVAQALHWFDLPRARIEFSRIMRPDGWCAVIYNERRVTGDPFHEGYERVLREFGIDYDTIQRRHLTPDRIQSFFAPSEMRRAVFPNEQLLTLEALQGRIMSSSYMPKPEQPRYNAMQSAIADLFNTHQQNGYVRLKYNCTVSYGKLHHEDAANK
jgi:SAM-dependent methyltransferase